VRPIALLVVAALVGAPAWVGPGAAAAPTRRPKSVAEATGDLERAERRLATLVERAKQDWRMAKVERYLSWSRVEDFTNPRRDVRVVDLVGWMADKDAPAALRERCRDALKSITHRSLDPDLSPGEGRSKRAQFSVQKLVPLLRSADPSSRAFAAEILDSYWHLTDPDIQRYDPRAGSERTWGPAISAWTRLLSAR
jgi:hypothetical protein